MSAPDPHRIRHDLPPDLEPAEVARMVEVGGQLDAARPLPAPGFRGELRRRLAGTQADGGVAPRRVRTFALSYALSGLLLLAVAALGVAGGGPFAA
ncbi:MAG TPA: hypothetical protein VFI03_07395 [Solirubrobacterales bacterium]|nr:hypothetical protein [Solirubrobacterales bacterium]